MRIYTVIICSLFLSFVNLSRGQDAEPDPFGPPPSAEAPTPEPPAAPPAPTTNIPSPPVAPSEPAAGANDAELTAAKIREAAARKMEEQRQENRSLDLTTTGNVLSNKQLGEAEMTRALQEARKLRELKASAGVYHPPVLYNAEQFMQFHKPRVTIPRQNSSNSSASGASANSQPSGAINNSAPPPPVERAEVPEFVGAAEESELLPDSKPARRKLFDRFRKKNAETPELMNPYTDPGSVPTELPPEPEAAPEFASIEPDALAESESPRKKGGFLNGLLTRKKVTQADANTAVSPYEIASSETNLPEENLAEEPFQNNPTELASYTPPAAPASEYPASDMLSEPIREESDVPAVAPMIAEPVKPVGIISKLIRKKHGQPATATPRVVAPPTSPASDYPPPVMDGEEFATNTEAGSAPSSPPAEPTVVVNSVGTSNYRMVKNSTNVQVEGGQSLLITEGTHLRLVEQGRNQSTVRLYDDRIATISTSDLTSVPATPTISAE